MTIKTQDLKVLQGSTVSLKTWPTKVEPVYISKDDYQERLEAHASQLNAQQELLYASKQYAPLLIF